MSRKNIQGPHVRIFRFRAEYIVDARALLRRIPSRSLISFDSITLEQLPDVVCQIKVRGFNLEAMREFCRTIPDGHVMLQTIQLRKQYTGERNYDLV